jgi:hypothetical protein
MEEKVMVHAYRMAAFAAAVAALVPRAVPAAEAPLVLERTIPLPAVAGRIDHMAVDLRRGTLFIGEVGAGALDALDLKSGRRIGRVEHLKEPQGVAYLEALDQVAVADGGDGAVRFYKAADLAPVGAVQLDGDADNLRLTADGMLVAADSRGFAVIDPVRRAVVSRATVGGHPEGFQLDSSGTRVIANVPDQRRIVGVDLATGKVSSSWSEGSLMNFPMALASSGVAAAVFRAPPQLLVLDSASGRALARIGACGDSDDLFFDQKRSRLYVSCGSGVVQTVGGAGAAYRSLGTVATRRGARTSLFVPAFDRLFVAAPAAAGRDAAILVLRPAP